MAKHIFNPTLLLLLLLPFLAITIQPTTCARLLDEVSPLIPPPADVPPPDPLPSPSPSPSPVPFVVLPVVNPVVSPQATAPKAVASTSDHPLTFFMHDVLGGTSPSARIVTGIVATSDFNSQLPFSKPNKDIFPINGAVPLPTGGSTTTNTIATNNIPYLTGLGSGTGVSSTTTAGIAQTNNGNLFGGNGGGSSSNAIPFVNGANLPAGSTLQNLLFGTTTVIDDELTEGHELGSAVIGKAQGFYVASSQDGTSQTVMFTAMMNGGGKGEGDYADTISFFGVHRKAAAESHVAVVGGTGKYENAGGFAAIQTVQMVDQHTTDGVETVLQISVHLS